VVARAKMNRTPRRTFAIAAAVTVVASVAAPAVDSAPADPVRAAPPAASAAPAASPTAAYVGDAACARCHAAIHQSWAATAHARAATSLGTGEAASSRCRACHATGDAPSGRAARPGVGCEACHGPGADYAPEDVMRDPALARALGLRDLSSPERRAAVCMRCHRQSTRLAPFDPESAWARIRHPASP
jgi:hypothetical protein